MTTPDRLYPSIPEATEGDLAIDLSLYAHPANDDRVRAIARLAAHHARRAAKAENDLLEAYELLASLADLIPTDQQDAKVPLLGPLWTSVRAFLERMDIDSEATP